MISLAGILGVYKTSYLIRATDSRIQDGLHSQDFFALHYPVKGQEIVSASIGYSLNEGDQIISTYRCLGDLIAAGVSPYAYFAEIMGKADGLSGGKGGCMHLSSPLHGFLATTGIVGGGLPIACGTALSMKLSGSGHLVFVTFGDGATTTGAFHEALNIAGLWALPVLFLCINNMYALHTKLSRITKNTVLYKKAANYQIPATCVNVSEPTKVIDLVSDFAEKVRKGKGPAFIEILAPRLHGHMAGSTTDYMNLPCQEELNNADSLLILRKILLSLTSGRETELQVFERETDDFVNQVYLDAMIASPPAPDALLTQITEA
ncbi:thiamine pyrophosphate-dependent dehydrogenase E1 component subunit alpha [Xenorhabdus koppenhoeferi]|uniref:Pyruvate dehydrogenase E1 component alpha subunit/2-oxoisovalerate dehydrogenase E1 component n=1 Tax=Xenorhabdus koppenhoeferi TaxID=351659 RepID=A0A1I7H3U9_9GAMM|nr:thiamine pyrophosphate-dependent dehydrogenase E1 component subunit alpha [Xenorhabdus koppenhoeferi]SFU55368.1 pyruvate dehydrogenase E1 component alpha subunit/2-oxoisovalerate dehydrogenase E1 component [Xenorhabdus koppenhoeferi]